jgi:hypothetical protein
VDAPLPKVGFALGDRLALLVLFLAVEEETRAYLKESRKLHKLNSTEPTMPSFQVPIRLGSQPKMVSNRVLGKTAGNPRDTNLPTNLNIN